MSATGDFVAALYHLDGDGEPKPGAGPQRGKLVAGLILVESRAFVVEGSEETLIVAAITMMPCDRAVHEGVHFVF